MLPDEPGPITAINPSGSGSYSKTFLVMQTPVVVGFSPAFGKVGTKVTIFGDNFEGATAVQFGTAAASVHPSLNKGGSLSAVVPRNAVSGPITVIVGGSLTADSGNDGFTIVTKPTPTGGPASAGKGTQITVTGSGFTGTSSVKFGSVSAAYSVTDDGHIVITIPTSSKVKTGSNQSLTITNAAGTGTFKLTITP